MRQGRTEAGRQLERLFRMGTVGELSDPQLLERFVAEDDESAATAFEAIVERHGPMVLRVCRLILRDWHAAEDVFQATFLVLARKARTLGERELLGNWLYGVATRTARKARIAAARRLARDRAVAARRPIAVVERLADEGEDRDEMSRVLQEEIERLPGSYRAAIVVCYLQGMTQAQAAQQLRLAESTVRGRLARARKLLCHRLTRRGAAPSTGSFAVNLSTSADSAAVLLPEATVRSVARTALLFMRSGQATHGAVSSTALNLTHGVLSTMWFHSIKTVTALLMAVGLLTAGAALLPQRTAKAQLPVGSS
jgi:RNA polymerase sigma factor (sigma-70 family)